MSLIITDALADTPASSIGGFDVMSFLPLILIFAVFYFLILRPQQKKLKTHQQMLANLRRGDRIVTNGGIIGTVSKLVSDQEVQLEIADDVKVRVIRSMITEVMSKTDPVANDDADAAQSKGTKKKSSE
ncbi:MAG: preprotein translocase subunit YajC [Alphaproteobacteria bacterium]|nr:preprotein translocase subunit YajC [Alphaproteobacteria bacterium]